MQGRKQTDQIRTGDCIGVTLPLFFEVVRCHKSDSGQVLLEVAPASCGAENCPSGCECHYSLFDGKQGPFKLRLDAKKRLLFAGNLEEDEAQLKLLAARVKRRRAGRSGPQNGEQSESVELSQ
jgi:hypothetical protein